MHRLWTLVLVSLLVFAPFPVSAGVYTFKDAIGDIAPDGKGYADAVEFISLLAGQGEMVSTTPRAEEYFEFVSDSMKRFDFRKVYASDFLTPMENGFRGTGVSCINQDGKFTIELLPGGEKKEITGDLGSFALDVALKRNLQSPVGGISYSGFFDTDFMLKQFSEDHLLRLLDNLTRVVSHRNVRKLEKLYDYNWEDTVQPFEVVDAFRVAFPTFMAWSDKYGVPRTKRKTSFYNHEPFTAFSLHLSSRMENIEADYPGVASRLEGLQGLARFFIVIKNAKGHVVATFIVDTDEEWFSLHIVEKNGYIVPVDISGKRQRPVFKDAYRLQDITRYPFTVEVTWDSKVAGLQFKTSNILLSGDYKETRDNMRFSLHLDNVDRTVITGAAYNVVPTWVLDLLVPGNFDDIIYDFAQCMVQANEGEGSIFVMDMDKKEPGSNKLNVLGSSEIIDNFFIRFGLRVLSNKFEPSQKEADDTLRMYHDAMTALLVDLTDMKEEAEQKTKGATTAAK